MNEPTLARHLSLRAKLQSRGESSLSQGIGDQNPDCAWRWVWLSLASTAQPSALAQALSSPAGWHYVSPCLDSLCGDWVIGATILDRHPNHTAGAGPSCTIPRVCRRPTGREACVSRSSCGQPGPVGKVPATRPSLVTPDPSPGYVNCLVLIFFICGIGTTLSLFP